MVIAGRVVRAKPLRNFRPMSAVPSANLLLASLDPDDFARLAPHLERVELAAGARIACSASPLRRVCFPETLVASFGEIVDEETRYDVGMIGREGLIGWPVLLGSAHVAHSGTVLLNGGTALVVPVETLLEICDRHRSLHTALLRFVQSFTVQMGQTIVASLRDGIDRRLARWLLMLHDRVEGDELTITHGGLAIALNVRRASVTDWLHVLEGERMVRCTRGQMVIRDRAALEAVAGTSYGPAESNYRELIGPFGKTGQGPHLAAPVLISQMARAG